MRRIWTNRIRGEKAKRNKKLKEMAEIKTRAGKSTVIQSGWHLLHIKEGNVMITQAKLNILEHPDS